MGQYVPFDESRNRDEFMLIEYDNILVNVNYLIIKKMLENQNKWINKYPGLSLFNQYEDDHLYIMSLSATRNGLLSLLSDDKLSESETKEDLIFLEKQIDFTKTSYTQKIMISLRDLSLHESIKEIYIYSNHLTDSKQRSIENIFLGASELGKVYTLEENSFSKMLKDEPKITTILIQDVDNISKAIKLGVNLERKQFLSPSSLMNGDRKKIEETGQIVLKYEDSEIELLSKYGCNLNYFKPNFIMEEEL